MGFSFSLGGSKSKGKEESSSIVTRFDAQNKKILDDFTKYLQDQLGKSTAQFSKESAIADSQGILSNLFNSFKATALPQIFAAQGSAGVYNDTTSQLLANNAYAETVGKGASIVADTIKNYATLGQQQGQLDYNALLGALQLQMQAVEKTNSSGSYKGSGLQFGLSASKGN